MSNRKIRVILTGATGMVGEGVLHECLLHPQVESVLVLGRKSCGVTHAKMKEICYPDLSNLSAIQEKLAGYDACFFCLGVSSVGMDADDYYRMTYTLTMHVAETLQKMNPTMTFCYISGAGTDGTEKGRSRWARVKGKTENDLLKLGFERVYNFRPAYLHPTKGLKNTLKYYRYVQWLYPMGRKLLPNYFITLSELGRAMIHVVLTGYDRAVLEVKDIVSAAR
jgi:nucleoside-diphosphate-sugar epimerase